MKTIIKIAWRNVWRNKLRSGVVLASVVMGIWAGLFVVSLFNGMMEQQKRSVLNTQVSHLKIHANTFIQDEKLHHRILAKSNDSILDFLAHHPAVKAYTTRTIVDGTITTAHGFKNVKIIGIDPAMEKTVTTIYNRLDTGTYLSDFKNNPVLIGRALSQDLKVYQGRSANLSFMTADNLSMSIGFKTEGIFSTGSGTYDETHLYVKKSDLNELLSTNDYTHEIAIMCHDIETADQVADDINAKFNTVTARPWHEVSQQLGYLDEMMGTSLMIILVIIIFALAFGIVNTMLMAVLERKRELGMLLCVGMNKRKVFIMIMFETIFLAIAAAPIGLLISWGFISYFGTNGINLMAVEDAMYQYGYDTMVYTQIDSTMYGTMTFMILVAAVVAAIYPARKALKYNPAEAVRAL